MPHTRGWVGGVRKGVLWGEGMGRKVDGGCDGMDGEGDGQRDSH